MQIYLHLPMITKIYSTARYRKSLEHLFKMKKSRLLEIYDWGILIEIFRKDLLQWILSMDFIWVSKAVVQKCSVKKMFLQISQNSQENTCARVSFLITLQASGCNFIKKEALAQALFLEFCEISKNTVSYKTPLVAASEDNRFRLTNWNKWTVSPNFVNRKLDLWMKKIFYGWSHQSLIERQNAMESILHLTYSHL